MQNIETIFFDLDGTLTDPKLGITKSIQYAFEQMGHTSPSQEELTLLIGPSLREYFGEVLGADKADAAINHYRQRYDHENMCLVENAIYPEILSVLEALQAHGKRMFIVTAKPQIIAERIIQHFWLDRFFQAVYGAELDETRSNKVELIAHVLEKESLSPDKIIMIGDRKHDVIGAAQNGIKSIGVAWGYGSLAELETAGASYIARQPADLLAMLLNPESRPNSFLRQQAGYGLKSQS